MIPKNPDRWYGFAVSTKAGPDFLDHETREGAAHLRAQEPDPERSCAPVAAYVREEVSRVTLDAAVADVRHEESRLRARALRYLNTVLSGTRTDEFPVLRDVERLLMNDNVIPEGQGR